MLDLLIHDGRIIDGTGTPWYRGDIGVIGDQIAAVGALTGELAHKTIHADGRIVCPGFIDMHTHSDLHLLADPLHECKTRQGITTDVIGHDGLGLAPITPQTAVILRDQLVGLNGSPDIDWNWGTITTYLDRFDGAAAVNVATHVPHGTIRLLVMGENDRPPTSDELHRMKALVDQGMREGAIGFSTGLQYAPAMFSTDDEVVALCEAMRPYRGVYSPHHRNYGMEALKGYADSIEIGRRAGVPVHLTHCHLSFPVNRGRAPELLALIDQARADGVEVTMDTYPYLVGNTYLHAMLPRWMHEGGSEAVIARLGSPEIRARLRHEMEVSGSDGFNGVPLGWEMVRIGGVLAGGYDRSIEGMLLPEAAARAGQQPFDFYCDLLVATRLGVSCLHFVGNEENVQAILRHPAHVVGSDGILVGGRPHPRGWGSHARFLAHYVRDLGLLAWEEGIRKITSASARRIGALDRGIIRPGFKADLVVFDPDTLQDMATFEDPRRYPVGVDFVAVNGTPVIEDGQPTGATPGRAIRVIYGREPERITSLS